jgi:hypothetical protein
VRLTLNVSAFWIERKGVWFEAQIRAEVYWDFSFSSFDFTLFYK